MTIAKVTAGQPCVNSGEHSFRDMAWGWIHWWEQVLVVTPSEAPTPKLGWSSFGCHASRFVKLVEGALLEERCTVGINKACSLPCQATSLPHFALGCSYKGFYKRATLLGTGIKPFHLDNHLLLICCNTFSLNPLCVH